MGDGSHIRSLLHFVDINITQGKGDFRQDAAAYGRPACQGDHHDTDIFPVAQLVFCQNTDISRVILSPAFFQLFYISVLNAGEFPQLLVIGVMSYGSLLILKQQI